jgi:hypothetical protein
MNSILSRSVAMRLSLRLRLLSLTLCTTFLVAPHVLGEGLEFTGDVRLRLRYIDSGRRGPLQGTYGELLGRGFTQKHRFVLEAGYALNRSVKVGGLVRVSNEDEAVLRSGPEYLSSEFGSAYIAYRTPTVNSRLGYYSLHYGPLSLMRWDLRDDPEGGGGACAVCPGTPGVAGSILGETLEELGPDLTFEGFRAGLSPGEAFSLDGFLTRSDIEDMNYPVLTFGGKAALTSYVERAASFLSLALLAVRSEEDGKAFEGQDGFRPEPFRNTVLGLTCTVPVTRWLTVEGEWVRTKTHHMEDRPREMDGIGGIIGLNLKPARTVSLEVSYIYLSPHWESYFRALSYSPDRRGMRLRCEITGRRLVIGLFAKYLTTIDAPIEHRDSDSAYPTLSARGYLKVTPDINLGLAAIYSGEGPEDDGLTLDVDEQRISFLGTLTLRMREDSTVNIEHRYILNRSETAKDYRVSSLSVYARTAIW